MWVPVRKYSFIQMYLMAREDMIPLKHFHVKPFE